MCNTILKGPLKNDALKQDGIHGYTPARNSCQIARSPKKADKINYTVVGGARNPLPNGIFKE
jgi:hypothetical protein